MKNSKENFEQFADLIVKNGSKEDLQKLLQVIQKKLGISDHFKWAVEWAITKYKSAEFDLLGEKAIPFATETVRENIVLDNGAEQLLQILGGISGSTAYSNANARIYVGSSSTAESASQTGVITALGNMAMDSSYPTVSGRTITFRATFDGDSANGTWNELAIYNGSGSGAVALNRKVQAMGTKAIDTTWVIQATISVLSV